MSNKPAHFIWYDLMTSDTKEAESFYKKVVGWETKDASMADQSYTILMADQVGIGGLMPISKEACAAGVMPFWSGYIWVDDVDAFVSRVTEAGGAVHRAPEDILGVGRFAVVADPQGAVFILFKSTNGMQMPQIAAGTPSHVGWHELHAVDGESAFAFYAKLFDWTKGEALDMGEMGVYQLFATGDAPVGGMMTKVPDMPVPLWLYYFNVEAIDAAAARITEAGGRIIMGPHQVPTGSWIVQGIDPQGALFALVGPKR